MAKLFLVLLGLLVVLIVIYNLISTTPTREQKTGCTRKTPYSLDEEIAEALNLVNEVYKKEVGANSSTTIDQLYNCLNITFAESDQEMAGAEGAFHFYPGDNLNNLVIKISPRYKPENPVIIGALLAHEVQHAFWHYAREMKNASPNKFSYTTPSCADEEAIAFIFQSAYLTELSRADRDYVVHRMAYSYSYKNDPEIEALSALVIFVGQNQVAQKSDPIGYIRDNFVLTNPAYQEQCYRD